VHGFEHRSVLADICTRRQAESAREARHFIGEDVAEQVRRYNHVELPRLGHELHRAGIDDAVVHLDAPLELPGHLAAGLEKEPRQCL